MRKLVVSLELLRGLAELGTSSREMDIARVA
ncbi:hypothetical protein P8452_45177 [Trifolium repens]|nr:hypothetical protein P8452_45177 [Trifolium repens]